MVTDILFVLWNNANLDVICSGQKDISGQPDPLVFAELEMLILVIKFVSKNKGLRPKNYYYECCI
ncbi:hypothetical protein BXY58_2994 [Epilithonimonas arachidiradicis]|uniref:Uncharacterized protein n=1 Tax=Epilithonimonas arachidiradicis TaxID=1617282 RepID=A0A420CPY9_9FLAO|nr:hypothetical protein BXY58_2994 [Epilithonimonas arachidiradicis]GGG63555.1 hypothetical protein GCM10007332_27170 [Epilithonimonas arachidiradicis]